MCASIAYTEHSGLRGFHAFTACFWLVLATWRLQILKASRFAFLRSFSTKGSQALLGQQNSLVSLDSYAFPTHEKSVTLSAATTRKKVAGMKLTASDGDGDEDALSPV